MHRSMSKFAGTDFRLCLLVVLGLSLSLMWSSHAAAVAVWGQELEARQSDGTILKILVWGDEYYRTLESLDGYTLINDPLSGDLCYARLGTSGDRLESTGIRAERAAPAALGRHLRLRTETVAALVADLRESAEAEAQAQLLRLGKTTLALPSSGNVQGICLLVDFSDSPATVPTASMDQYCNLVGYTGNGSNGSVRDYFYDVSDGALTYTNYVPAHYYRALHPKTYYNDPNIPYAYRARELVLEALNDLESSGFDFSQYDANNDNIVDAVNVFYAGEAPGTWSSGLWPHSWSMYFAADGVTATRYQMTNIGAFPTLGVFCHENGHMLCGWPDLYDYDFDSLGAGVFCLMSYYTSATNPQQPCAYMKVRSNWATVFPLVDPSAELAVPAASNVVYKHDRPGFSNEYYLIENRQQNGRDLQLPDAGLAIWHIDTYGSNNNQQQTPTSHYLVTLVQADNDWDLERNINYGDATDLWSVPGYEACTPLTHPKTNWWDGSASDLSLSNISVSAPVMTVAYRTISFTGAPVAGSPPLTVAFHAVTTCDPSTCNWDFGDGVGTSSGASPVYTYLSPGTYSVTLTVTNACGSVSVTRENYVSVWRQRRYVSASGNNTAPYMTPETAAHTILAAVSAGADGDSVLVAGGSYIGSVAVNGKIRMIGGWSPDFVTRDPIVYPTSLQGFNSAVRFSSPSEDFGLVDGFVFHNSVGAIYEHPAPGRHGGAVLAINCSPTIRNCRFENNMADPGSGYGLGGAVMGYGGSPRIENCTFIGNRATSGGAVALVGAINASLQGNVFLSNSGSDSTSGHIGGGLFVSGGSVGLTDDQFTGNGGMYEGGGIGSENAEVVMQGVRLARNRAVQSGGGMLVRGGGVSISGGVVADNRAGSGGGGGLACGNASITLRNVCVTDNVSSGMGGGAQAMSLVSGAVENCVFAENTAAFGGGLFVNNAGPVTVRNNCIVSNQGIGLAGGGTGGALIDYNDVWNNTGGDYMGWLAGAHDIAADPLFVNPATGDYGLGLHSVCLDRGDPNPACADPDGSRADIGAFGGPGAATIAPAAVAGGQVIPIGGGRVRVSWSPNAEPDLARYVVYRDTAVVFTPTPAGVAASVNRPDVEWTDDGPYPRGAYYLVVAVDSTGHVGGYSSRLSPNLTDVPQSQIPETYRIVAIVPNPFNPATRIDFDLPAAGRARLEIYDAAGRRVRALLNEERAAGRYGAVWDGTSSSGARVASGVYFCRLQAGGFRETRRMTLVK